MIASKKNFVGSRLFYFLCFLSLFAIEAFIALYVRDAVIRPYAGDVLVVVLVYCFARVFVSHPYRWLPLTVFLFACSVEVMQYLRAADVLGLQQGSAVRVMVGSVFDWKDIVCYAIGCIPLFFIRK